jgi:hypothetical protein
MTTGRTKIEEDPSKTAAVRTFISDGELVAERREQIARADVEKRVREKRT